ncbi:MAG: hypothetical protein RL095_4066 [Verrucomicrobiota bacterium]|jgi:hypothetical protein
MKPVLALTLQTCREAARSRLLLVLALVLAVAMFFLPSEGIGDGSASGALKVRLEWSIGFSTLVASLAALWIGTLSIAREVDGQQFHLLYVKPVGASSYWAGRFLGASLVSFALFLPAAACTWWRLEQDRQDLKQKALIQAAGVIREAEELDKAGQLSLEGKELLMALSRALPQFFATPEAWREFLKATPPSAGHDESWLTRLREATAQIDQVLVMESTVYQARSFVPATPPAAAEIEKREIERLLRERPGSQPEDIRAEALKSAAQLTRSVEHGKSVVFTAEGVPATKEGEMFVRAKFWPSSLSGERLYVGVSVIDPESGADTSVVPWVGNGGDIMRFGLNPKCRGADGKVRIRIHNVAESGSFLVQLGDGPFILGEGRSFGGNFILMSLAICGFLAILAAAGCSFGLCFSTPVALFMSGAYLFLSQVLGAVANPEEGLNYQALRLVTATHAEFDLSSLLARGQALGSAELLPILVYGILIKGGLLYLAGRLALERREFGKEARR